MFERHARWIGFFWEGARERLLTEQMHHCLSNRRPIRWMQQLFGVTEGLDPADAAMAVDVQSYLPYDLLVKVDITSMANSLEARSPFLDHEVMELAARLPAEIKFRGGRLKSLLKRAFADLLPPKNVNRRKMGFGVPVGQ